MKKALCLCLAAVMLAALTACGSASSETAAQTEAAATAAAETTAAQTEAPAAEETREGDGSDMTIATEFNFDLKENEEVVVEKTVFNEDVIISGDYATITFHHCDFNGDIILTSKLGTKCWLGEGNLFHNGAKCVLRNGVTEADMNYDMPKFMSYIPYTAVTDNCVGAATGLFDIDITFNGTVYHIKDASLYMDEENPENGMVPYSGQEDANFCYVANFREGGKDGVTVICMHVAIE